MFWKATDRASRWNSRSSKSDWKRPRYSRWGLRLGAARAEVGSYFNELNAEEPSRYVEASQCALALDWKDADAIDADALPDDDRADPDAGGEPRRGRPSLRDALAADTSAEWRSIYETPFLDAARTPPLARALKIPFFSKHKAVFGLLRVLERTPSDHLPQAAEEQKRT